MFEMVICPVTYQPAQQQAPSLYNASYTQPDIKSSTVLNYLVQEERFELSIPEGSGITIHRNTPSLPLLHIVNDIL
jgi:hypothetical protein